MVGSWVCIDTGLANVGQDCCDRRRFEQSLRVDASMRNKGKSDIEATRRHVTQMCVVNTQDSDDEGNADLPGWQLISGNKSERKGTTYTAGKVGF